MNNCCYIDCEETEVYSARMVRARETHTCCECNGVINPDDLYEHASGLWDDNWEKYKTCRLCTLIRDDLFRCGWYHGGLEESLGECYGLSLRGPL